MNILVKSSNGINQVSMESKLLMQRKVWLEGKLTLETACDFAKKIMILNGESKEKNIDFLICSPGP